MFLEYSLIRTVILNCSNGAFPVPPGRDCRELQIYGTNISKFPEEWSLWTKYPALDRFVPAGMKAEALSAAVALPPFGL
jgi:hypothetical protein